MSIFDEKNSILNKKKLLPELDDEMVVIKEQISKMTMDELWGPDKTLMELLDK